MRVLKTVCANAVVPSPANAGSRWRPLPEGRGELGEVMTKIVREERDGTGFNLFHVKVFTLLALALLADSYDLQATSFAAPVLAKLWHLKPAAFAPLIVAISSPASGGIMRGLVRTSL